MNRSMRDLLTACLFTGSMLVTLSAAASGPDHRKTDEAAVRAADAEWAKVAKTGKVDAWLAFYSEDAVVMPPNEPMTRGREAARKPVEALLSLKDLSISWEPNTIEVAESGDLAYLIGTYQLSFSGSDGQTVSDRGKLLEIWKKQSDGAWKCSVDTWSSDNPG